MSAQTIEEQLKVIKRATDKAVESKESALNFLIDAGLIQEVKPTPIKAAPVKQSS